jgi:AcrR family transcriptional regulator
MSQPSLRPSKKVASRLDLETIVLAGLALASKPGPVRVRDLGAILGADPTAIYRHVSSKDGLVRVLLDRITGMVIDRIQVQPSDWRAYLRECSTLTFEVFMQYPAIGAEAIRLSSDGDNELRIVDGVLSAFRHAGLNEADCVRYYGIWSVFVLSFAAGAARERLDRGLDEGDRPWLDRHLSGAPDFPEVGRHRDLLERITHEGAYADGVDLILRSAEDAARGPR